MSQSSDKSGQYKNQIRTIGSELGQHRAPEYHSDHTSCRDWLCASDLSAPVELGHNCRTGVCRILHKCVPFQETNLWALNCCEDGVAVPQSPARLRPLRNRVRPRRCHGRGLFLCMTEGAVSTPSLRGSFFCGCGFDFDGFENFGKAVLCWNRRTILRRNHSRSGRAPCASSRCG
jgi:hypothetical protein